MSDRDQELIRHEEELVAGTRVEEVGSARAHKFVGAEHVEELVSRDYEDADVERASANEQDSGEVETLPDGSVSIPILEEELVITKRMVVRERVIIRKRTVTEQHRVEAELLRERVEIDADPGVELTDETSGEVEERA
jgi:uncharacterized protein (TIGR02271 family)